MPPAALIDTAALDTSRILVDREGIGRCNPQRFEMQQLSAIIHLDVEKNLVIGYKDVRPDEFWVAGHIPGRPLLPGVLMIEAAAQLASFYVKAVRKWDGFIGFGGVEHCKFRQQVLPGCRLYLMAKQISARHSRFTSAIQGLVNGQLVFESTITGVELG